MIIYMYILKEVNILNKIKILLKSLYDLYTKFHHITWKNNNILIFNIFIYSLKSQVFISSLGCELLVQ